MASLQPPPAHLHADDFRPACHSSVIKVRACNQLTEFTEIVIGAIIYCELIRFYFAMKCFLDVCEPSFQSLQFTVRGGETLKIPGAGHFSDDKLLLLDRNS